MKYSNTIEYNINTKLDNSGLIKLQSQIKQLENSMQQMSNRDIINESQVQEAKKQLEGLNTALTNSFNSSLGILDLSKFRAELDSSGVSAKGLQSAFNMMGAEGQVALNSLTTQIADFNGGIERTSSAVDKIFTTFSNTFRWGMISSFFSQFMNAIHSSIDYVKELDDSLTQIMLVTDYNRDSMNQFAKSANEAAKAVSMTTTGMTNASLIFAQQGYDLGQSQELATLSAKLANASQQDTATTSDQITAYMNAYGLENSIAELTQQMDNWALIANVSAADVGELAQASQRAASMANAVGVSGEQLAAQIATIESVTREAPEQIGNGLKTLYARFSDIAAGGEDEDGFDLGKVTSELNAIGVQIFDQMGQIRDVGDIMEDLMVIWNDLDQTSKVAASQALAGKYQVNRFMALMDNTDMYQEYKGATGSAATGTLDIMNEEYADSIAGRITKIQASLEGLFSTIFNTDDIYPWIDAAQGAVDLLQQFFDALGGGKVVLLGISTLLARTFNQNIARSINDVIANRNLGKIREQNVATVGDTLDRVGIDRSQGVGKYIEDTANQAKLNALSEKQYNDYMNNIQDWANASAALTKSEEDLINHVNTLNMVFGQLGEENAAVLSKEGLNTYGAASNRGVLTNKDIVEAINGMDFTEVAGQAGIVANKLRDLQNIFNSGSLEANALAEATQHATEELMQFGKVQGFSSVRGEQLISDLNALSVKIKDDGEVTEESKKKLQSYITEMENLKRIASTMTSDKAKAVIADAGDTAQKVKSDVDFNRIREGRAEKNALEGQKNIDSQQNIKQILDTVNAVQELSFAWQSFQNLGSIWSNEDLSMGEKTIQTIMNVTASLYNLIPAIDKVTNSLHFSGKMSDAQKEIENSKKAVENAQKILSLSSQSIDPIKEKVAVAQQAEDEATQAWLNKQEEALQQSKEIAEATRELQQAQDARTDSQKRKNKSTPDMHAAQEKLNKAQERQAEIKKEVLDLEEKTDKAFRNTLDAQGDLNDAIEQQRRAKVDVEKATKNQEAAEKNLAAIEMKRVALNLAISAAMAGIAIAISAIQEEERKRVQAITDAAEESRTNLDAIENSSFFEQWDAFKENGELTDELKDSMAALAQQMGINIEAQDIYAGNIEQLNDKIRDNIKLEKERARTNFEAENKEFETQLNKNSIQAAQIGGTITTATGTFNSAVDYIGQAGAAKTLAERLGEVANAQSAVTAAREKFGKDSLEYNNALDNYQKLRDQLKNDEVDIDKVNSNFKQLADLAIEEFKAGRDAQSLTGADWINFLNSDGGAEVRDYMESLGEEAGLQFKLGLLSQSDAENPIYSMIKGPGQIDLSNANLSNTEETNLDLQNLIQSGINPEELGFKTWDDFAQAFVSAGNNAELTINPKINLESKYDFDSQEEIEQYLEDYTDIDSNILETATQIRVDTYSEKGNRYNGAVDYAEQQNALAESNFNQAEQEQASAGNLHVLEEATQKLDKAESKLIDTQDKLTEAQADADHDQKMYEKSMRQSAAAAARMIKTLDKMNDHFDDNKEILEEGSESTIDYAEALAETKEDLAGLLDIDPSMLSNEFASSEEALEAMNTMLHGTEEEAEAAYEHLRELAAADVISNLEFNIPVGLEYLDGTEVTAESIQQILMDMISSLNTQDLTIGMEADIDTTDWYARVNELLASGAITADQLTQVLSSAGYKGQIKYEEAEGDYPATTYTVVVEGEQKIPVTAGGDDASSIVAPSVIKMIPQTEMIHGKTVIPVLEGATQAGGFTNGGGGRHQSSGGGGGGGGKSCFVAGTLISTSLGFKPIEQIQKEDIVLSYNRSIGLNEYSKVLQTMIHDTTEPIYTLYIKNEQLKVTGIHRFLVTDKITCGVPQWVHAADLKAGQWVLFADGTWHVIHKIEINIEHQTVYNFEVSHNHNYYVGRNQILAHNKGGSGGKGSSPKAKEPKKIEPKEKKEHEKDYYEEVDNQLDKVEKTLSKIEEQEDRLVGTKARANQNRQINLLEKEIKLQQEKLEILEKQEQVDVWKALKDKDKEAQDLLNANGIFLDIPDAHVDGDGIIENYEEISAAIDKAHNELIDKYNAAAAASNEEETKRLEEQIEKFDDLGESILKNSQRANEIQVEIEDLNGVIEELKYNIQDIQNEAYEAARESQKKIIELKEDAAELKGLFRDFDDNSLVNAFSIDDTPYQDLITSLEKLDTIYNVSKDDATAYYDNLIQKQEALKESTTDPAIRKAAEDTIRFYREQQALLSDEDSLENGELGRAIRELEMLKRWIDNPDAEDNVFKNDEATLWKMYEEASKDAKEAFEDFREEVQNYRDSILDIYDDQEDAIDRQIDQFDRLTEKIERISDTYKLYYGEDSYDQLDKFYAQQGNVMQNQLNQLTNAYNHWQDQYQKALDTGDKELIQEIQDKMDDAEDAMLDAAQELAELWVEKFENAVEASSQHIYKNLFGSNDIDELTDNWELQKDYMDRYKDDVEKAYEIDKLRSKYINLLNDAQGSSAQTQNRIRQQMQEQLDLLQNQTTVSEYDVKLANAKLEILQKQMALEDAQRNKNKMQLRRDTQGNYRYVYTADQGNVAEAQQDLEDSEYDAYEMTKNETVANNDRAINLLQDYIQKRAAIWNKYKDDATARGQALAELEAEYEKTFSALAEDFTNTSNGMYDILNWLVKNGSEDTTTAAIEMLDTLYDKNGEIKDKTGQDWMDLASMIQDQVLPKITDAVTKADLELEDQAVSLKDSMTGPNGALTKIGSGAEDVGNSMDAAAEATRDLASATEELFTALGADDGKLQKALDKVSQYESQLQKTQSTTSSLANQLGVANQTIAAKTAESNNYRTTLDYLTGAKDFEAGQDIRLKKGAYVTYHRDGKTQWDSEGKGGFNIPRDMTVHIFDPNEQLNGSDAPNNVAVYPIDAEGWGPKRWEEYTMTTDQQQHQMWHINKDTAKKFLAYDTGGYTGEWNDSSENLATGKVALLHQKELVLNATDTENILNAVNIMRDITDSIKNANSYISAFKTGNFTGNQEIIKQRVEISATFPNVSSITDIEQALMNLSDQAYIYANKTI